MTVARRRVRRGPRPIVPVGGLLVAVALAGVGAAGAGCARDELEFEYGKSYGKSVNGFGVLAELLRGRGHAVRRVSGLGPASLRGADVVIVVARDGAGIDGDFEYGALTWLTEGPHRTFVYVGHDFVADLHLWDDLRRHFEALAAGTGAGAGARRIPDGADREKLEELAGRKRDAQGRELGGGGEESAHSLAFRSRVRREISRKAMEAGGSVALLPGRHRYPLVDAGERRPTTLAAPLDAGSRLAGAEPPAARVYVRHHPERLAPLAVPVEPELELDLRTDEEIAREWEQLARAELLEGPLAGLVAGEPAEVEALEGDAVDPEHAADGPEPRDPWHRYGFADLVDEVLLSAEGRPLVTRYVFDDELRAEVEAGERIGMVDHEPGDGELIVVHNASFLLNYSLIDPEHRLLASRFADLLGQGRDVVFLEAGASGTRNVWWFGNQPLTGFDPLSSVLRPPLLWILLHWLVLGALFVLWKSPIFGRPRQDEHDPTAPFVGHARAYGRLLQRTKARAYARAIIRRYETEVRSKR